MDFSTAARMVTSGSETHPPWSFPHRCQDGNVGFLGACTMEFFHCRQDGNVAFLNTSTMELTPSLARW